MKTIAVLTSGGDAPGMNAAVSIHLAVSVKDSSLTEHFAVQTKDCTLCLPYGLDRFLYARNVSSVRVCHDVIIHSIVDKCGDILLATVLVDGLKCLAVKLCRFLFHSLSISRFFYGCQYNI